MTIDRRLIAGAAGLAILLAACGGTAASPAATAGQPASGAPATAATATDEPAVPTEEASDDGINLPPGATNDLASRLPAEINGVAYERVGLDGSQLGMYGAAAGFSDSELGPVLEQHGKTINDVNFAIATPSGGTGAGMIYALQVEGVNATDWMAGVNMDPSDFEARQIGGKNVFAQGAGGFNVYAYPSGDALFILLLGDDATAEGLFSQLP